MKNNICVIIKEKRLILTQLGILVKSFFFTCLLLQFSYANERHIKLCVDPDWYPYEQITPDGKYTGIASELIENIMKKASLSYSVVRTQSWDESIEFSKKGFCDGLAFLNKTPEREKWLVFTDPYFTDPNVIISREDSEYISDLRAFPQLKIALPKSSSILEKVQKDFPKLQIIEVASEDEAFTLVSQGKADITLRSLTMAIYTIKAKGLFNLKVAGEVPTYANRLRLGINKEKAFFKDFLNKAIMDIEPTLAREITNKYVGIKIEQQLSMKEIVSYLLVLFLPLSLLFGFLVYQRKMNNKLESINERYKSLIEGSFEGILVLKESQILFSNPALSDILGYSFEELQKLTFEALLYEKNESKMLFEEGKNRLRFLTKDSKIVWVEISQTIIPWDDNNATLYFIVDITQRIESEEKIIYMAHHDALTGLPNRWLIDDRLEQQIALAKREKSKFALLFVDLNKFKPINDTYGHEVGDFVLKTFASRLVEVLRDSDTVSRIGGDEYVIILPNIKERGDAQRVIQKIMALSKEPFIFNNTSLFLTCSVGVAVFPDDADTKETLYVFADKSMYLEKKN